MKVKKLKIENKDKNVLILYTLMIYIYSYKN